MRCLFILLCCCSTIWLTAQQQIYFVDFDNGIPNGEIPFGIEEQNTLSDFFGGFQNSRLLGATGPVDLGAQPSGLVAMIDHSVSNQAQIPSRMELDGTPFHGEITSGVVEIALDIILENQSFLQGAMSVDLLNGDDVTIGQLQLEAVDGGLLARLLNYDPTTGLALGFSEGVYLPIHVWHNFRLLADLDANTISLFIYEFDTELSASIGRPGGSGFLTTALNWEPTFIGMMCVDNIRVQVPDVAGATLPVVWGATAAEWVAGCEQVEVAWQTAAEENIRAFYLERLQRNGRWQTVGERLMPGRFAYKVADPSPEKSTALYRARSEDWDGSFTYSEVFGPESSVCQHGEKLALAPNPVSAELNVTNSSGDEGAYRIMNVSGREVLRGKLTGERTRINVHLLPAGIYWLCTADENLRFIVE